MRAVLICVDLSEATRHLVHATVKLPVKPGTTARLTTPLWIPESHLANGPVSGIANLHFSYSQNEIMRELRWRRNPRAGHEYLVRIPPDVETICVEFDSIITRNITRRMVLFGWEHVLLYPIGAEDHRTNPRFNIDKLPIQASVILPEGWEAATALENLGQPVVYMEGTKKVRSYGITTVRGLADSPILAGSHVAVYSIRDAPIEKSQELLCLAADQERYTEINQTLLQQLSTMTSQIQLLFGSGLPPYSCSPVQRDLTAKQDETEPAKAKFRFLVALTSHLPNKGGIEHSASAEIIAPLNGFSRPYQIKSNLALLAHEYIHCWNGKLLIPKGHHPNDFNTPLDGRLLWVYEGLTTYYENIIPVRAGVLSKEEWITNLAVQVAKWMGDMGRQWRSLEDIGTGTSVMRGGVGAWDSWRGNREGIYYGGALIWLGVDVLLRKLTAKSSKGPNSLDDFMASFFGLPKESQGQASNEEETMTGLTNKRTSATVTEYKLDDIALELNKICKYDWKSYFQARVVDIMPEVDLSPITNAGYRFGWTTKPLVTLEMLKEESIVDAIDIELDDLKRAIWNSIGLNVGYDGLVNDVRRCGPADKADLAPLQTIVGVGEQRRLDGEKNILNLIAEAITRAAESQTKPIRLLMVDEDDWTVEIHYFDGLRYPNIERDINRGLPDLFDDILRPRVAF